MNIEIEPTGKEKKQITVNNQSSSPVYGLGMIGAWIYYFSKAKTTEERVKAFFKAFVWPAILVIEALKFFDKNVDG